MPNETALYKLLQQEEKGLPIHYDDWGVLESQQKIQQTDVIVWKSRNIPKALPLSRSSKKKIDIGDSCAAEGEDTRLDVLRESGWRGHIRLMVIPIRTCDWARIGFVLARQRPKLIDICSYIGAGGLGPYWSLHGVEPPYQPFRLYFDPAEYPPPLDLDKGGKGPVFDKLRSYIRDISARDLSPVFCNGGNSKYRSKEFACKSKFRNVDGKRKRCPFYFQVRWDDYGYYIHLHRICKMSHCLIKHNCGSAWHCCKG